MDQDRLLRALHIYRGTNLTRKDWSPTQLRTAHQAIDDMQEKMSSEIGEANFISQAASIHPTAILGTGIVIGDHTSVGPYSYLRRNVVLAEGVEIGYGVELDNVIVHSASRIMHQSCIGRSVIGSDCNVGYGFVVATHRLDRKPVRVSFDDGSYYESPASHHGAVLGAGVQIGVNVALMPGVSVAPGSLLFSRNQSEMRSPF